MIVAAMLQSGIRLKENFMRIAQVSPLHERVPPVQYGGTERVVSYLTEALVERGHEVTLFASGDSKTSARLEKGCPRSLRLDPSCLDPLAQHLLMLERVYQSAETFDVIHFHLDYLPFSMIRRAKLSAVTTLHGRLDLPELFPVFREFTDMNLISISHQQRKPLVGARWLGTVPHGLPKNKYSLGEGKGGYLVFLGRVAPEKGVDRAIEIATRAGLPLKIAAKVSHVDREYYSTQVAPLIRCHPGVEYLGEIGDAEKSQLLGEASALLFPIDWPEPFGVVMIEAMACGTPTVAFRRGSVPEVIQEEITGYIVEDVARAVQAVEKTISFDRVRCRRYFETHYTADRMAKDYVNLYQKCLDQKVFREDRWRPSGRHRPTKGSSVCAGDLIAG
jgi:glycosyltransferase involved in cell wall biosynthesis